MSYEVVNISTVTSISNINYAAINIVHVMMNLDYDT